VIKVGIIGFGKMGRIRYDTILDDSEARVVAIAEPSQEIKLPRVKLYSDPEEVIHSPDVDAVFICTPNYLNHSLTLQALAANKHVFCEKPPAFSSKDVEQVIDAERISSGITLMYGFNHRHHDSMKFAKDLIDSQSYGRLLWMRGRYGKSVDESFYQNWRSKKEFAGGGILMDQGIHMVDLFLMMAGDFHDVNAYVSNVYWKLDVEDNVFAILRNDEGVVASLHSTMTQWRHLFSLEMFLEKGYIVINGLLTSSGTYGEEAVTIAKNRTTAPAAAWSDEEHIRFEVNNSWKYEVQHFFQSIRDKTPIQTGNSQDALKLMRVIDKIYAQD